MRPWDAASRLGAGLAVALPLVLAGCGGSGPREALDAAIVPGADVVVRMELAALREAPIFAGLHGDEEAPDAATPADDSGEAPALDGRRFLEVTGLEPDDVVTLVFSADLDPLDVDPGSARPELDRVPAAAALRLARPLDLDTLEKAILAAAPPAAAPTVTRLELSGVPALHVEASGPEASKVFLASVASGTILLVAAARDSLAGALDRTRSGEAAPLAGELERLVAALPAEAQTRVGFVVPQKFRDGLKARLEEPPPELAAFAGFAAPFEDLQSLSLSVHADQDLTVVLAGDLGADEPAQQASAILGGLLGPMAKSALASALHREAAEVDDRLRVAAEGSALAITLRLTAEDLAALRAKPAETAAAPE